MNRSLPYLLIFVFLLSSCGTPRRSAHLFDHSLMNTSFERYDENQTKKLEQELEKIGYKFQTTIQGFGLRPWYITSLQSASESLLVIIEIYPSYEVPDMSYGKVVIVGKDKIDSQIFPIGYRMFASDLKVFAQKDRIEMVLKRTSSGPFMIEDGQRQPLAVSEHDQLQYWEISKGVIRLQKTTKMNGETVSNSDGWNRSSDGWMQHQSK